jgi:hypothetical protein
MSPIVNVPLDSTGREAVVLAMGDLLSRMLGATSARRLQFMQ